MSPRVSFATVRALARVICGDAIAGGEDVRVSPYRTARKLDELFLEELGLTQPETAVGSRVVSTEGWLKAFNGTPTIRAIVEASVRPADYVGSEYDVAAAVEHLNGFLVHDGLRLVHAGNRYVLATASGVMLPPGELPDVLSDAYVQELSAKCDARLSAADLDGAVTIARTFVEAILGELEERLEGARTDYKGDLLKQYKAVAKRMRLDDERADLDDRFKAVVRGLMGVISGLAPLRNKMSDGHARVRKPAPHHARVVVNAAKTVATFLVESYAYQRDRGTLLDARSGQPEVSE